MTGPAPDWDPLVFHVPGVPIPQAEVRPGNVSRRTGKRAPSYYPNGAELYPWREAITLLARAAASRRRIHHPKHTPVQLDLIFWLPRPPSVSPRTRPLPTVKPDVQHLVRAVEDAITASGIWVDDGQVVLSSQEKRYADHCPPGVTITIQRALCAPATEDVL